LKAFDSSPNDVILPTARWIDAESVWALTFRNVAAEDPAQAVYTVKHNVVIMATGPLSQPKMPQNINLDTFQGQQFHSQAWRHDISFGMTFVVSRRRSLTEFDTQKTSE
jgi:cation diffusion facilitator CzcD-associated flavoprotein CzcO